MATRTAAPDSTPASRKRLEVAQSLTYLAAVLAAAITTLYLRGITRTPWGRKARP